MGRLKKIISLISILIATVGSATTAVGERKEVFKKTTGGLHATQNPRMYGKKISDLYEQDKKKFEEGIDSLDHQNCNPPPKLFQEGDSSLAEYPYIEKLLKCCEKIMISRSLKDSGESNFKKFENKINRSRRANLRLFLRLNSLQLANEILDQWFEKISFLKKEQNKPEELAALEKVLEKSPLAKRLDRVLEKNDIRVSALLPMKDTIIDRSTPFFSVPMPNLRSGAHKKELSI